MTRYLITQKFSIDKGKEFAQIYLSIFKDFPSYVKLFGNSPYITTTEDEVNIYTLIEIPEEITGKSLKVITEFFNKYNKIEGHKWNIATLIKRREALKWVGLSLDDLNK